MNSPDSRTLTEMRDEVRALVAPDTDLGMLTEAFTTTLLSQAESVDSAKVARGETVEPRFSESLRVATTLVCQGIWNLDHADGLRVLLATLVLRALLGAPKDKREALKEILADLMKIQFDATAQKLDAMAEKGRKSRQESQGSR